MTHLLTRTSGVKADGLGNLPLTLSSLLPSPPLARHEVGASAGNYVATLPATTFQAYIGGGTPSGVESNVLLSVPVSGSSYPNFLEWGPERIGGNLRMANSVVAGVSVLLNSYSGGLTRYYCGIRLTVSGTYRLSADWCVGALTPSGGSVDVQWRTSTNQQLGHVARMGRNDERQASCDGYVVVSSTTDVGLYVVAIVGAPRYNIQNFVDICITAEKIA